MRDEIEEALDLLDLGAARVLVEAAKMRGDDGVVLATIQAVGAETYERSIDGRGGQV